MRKAGTKRAASRSLLRAINVKVCEVNGEKEKPTKAPLFNFRRRFSPAFFAVLLLLGFFSFSACYQQGRPVRPLPSALTGDSERATKGQTLTTSRTKPSLYLKPRGQFVREE